MIRNILLMHAGGYGCRVQTTADSVSDEAELVRVSMLIVQSEDMITINYHKEIEMDGLWAHQYCILLSILQYMLFLLLTFCLWNDYMVTCSLETDKTYRSNFRFQTPSVLGATRCLPNLMPKMIFVTVESQRHLNSREIKILCICMWFSKRKATEP